MASRLFAKLSRIRSIAPVNLKTSVPRCSAYAYPAQHLSLAGQTGEPRRRYHRNSVAHGEPTQFAILNHAAVDSGTPIESATQRIGCLATRIRTRLSCALDKGR